MSASVIALCWRTILNPLLMQQALLSSQVKTNNQEYYALNKLLLAFCQAYTFSADADSFFYSASLLRSSRNESVPFQLS